MSFTVHRVEDPTIYVRRNIKPDILGISSAWDNIVDIKQSLNRLEDDVVAANKRPKLSKNTRTSDGKVLKEISTETQQLGKVTRFQLLDEKPRKSKYVSSKLDGRKAKDWSTVSDISSIPKTGYSDLNEGKDGYSPTRYTGDSKTGNTIHSERPTYFERSTIHPTILNDPPPILNNPPPIPDDPPPSKDSSFANTSVNSLSSQQFSVTSSPSFHGKTVLARNEAALQKIKEKVRKQKEMLSKTDDSGETHLGERKLHDSSDHVTIDSKLPEQTEEKPAVPLKRKVGIISAAGPTYKGFNAVSEPKQKKVDKQKAPALTRISKDNKQKIQSKPGQKQEKKLGKGKMTRIVGTKRPQEIITTTSWRDGQANVKRVLNVKKAKTSDKKTTKTDKIRADKTTAHTDKGLLKNNKATGKTNTTYDVESEDELSEGRLSSDNDVMERVNAKIEKFEAEKDVPEMKDDTVELLSDEASVACDDQKESKIKDVLSKEAQSMLVDLARDSSESDSEISKEVNDKKPKSIPPKKKTLKTKKSVAPQKPVEDVFPKGKTRHYDQAEVQKYMAHQLAERKKKQKQEKIQKKKQEEEKQQRLKDLYERQKKSFAPSKKDKQLGKTFSFGNFDIRVPGQEICDPESNKEYIKDDQVVQNTSQNESDKENTDIDEMMKSSHEISSERYTDDADITSTEDILTTQSSLNSRSRRISAEPVIAPAPSMQSLDQRAQRLSALQATALALQSRLQSHALRLSGATEGVVTRPAAKVTAQPMEIESSFQGVLPGVANIRKHADETEKQSTRVAAATKIQAVYRGHTVRKQNQWMNGKIKSDRSGNTRLMVTSEQNKPISYPGPSQGARLDFEQSPSEGSSDDVQFRNIQPFYETEQLNNNLKRTPLKDDGRLQRDEFKTRSNFLRNEFSAPSATHFTAAPARYEPRGDRFSVMNIFSRRHPTLSLEDILNDEPGSETASLLDVNKRRTSEQEEMDYEDDFTDASSVISESGDVKKDPSKAETYSECFETDEETDTKHAKERTKTSRSSLDGKKTGVAQVESEKRLFSKRDERIKTPPLLKDDNISSDDHHDIRPSMASTMKPDTRSNPSISPSEENEPIRRRPYMPLLTDRTGGTRLSPDSLQRKLTAEINLLENVEDSVRQVSDIERTRAVSLAQQETVSLAQILKAKQQTHEQEMHNLRLKAKEEAIQAAKDLEKTRQAAAEAAATAAERLVEVQTEAMKTNVEQSRKYMNEANRMTSDLLSNTSSQLAQFCKNLTSTTSAAVEDLHKIRRPTTTLVERATSISEGHAINSDQSSTSDDRTRTSDVISNQSKSLESSPSVRSQPQQTGYSSDEFESYKSQTAKQGDSEIKTENTHHGSLSAESIAEDLPEKSISEDTTIHENDTTIHDEFGDDTRGSFTREINSKGHDSVSSVLDYSSQFDDSSHALTDEDIDFNFLLPSREHRRKSMRRIKDISFEEDRRKEKSVRTPFEGDDSFGKFTAEMIQKYIHEEEVRTKHQAAILRLREKSLKEKTKADLQWLEQMKKQSRDKGSDDVMPSIKKRERGIRMKHKAEKEEIKYLKATNRASSFQRRFMMYQQQEIQRLHQATLRIQNDTSKKRSDHSSRESSQSLPRTSSPVLKPNSKSQSTPSSNSKPKNNESASAKSISEEISGEQRSSHLSPNTTASSFPSYNTPKSEDGNQQQMINAVQTQPEPETSTILNMLSTVHVGLQSGSNEKEKLLEIYKMLLDRQEKLVKDESEVKSMLQKVTEMLKNQKNLSPAHSSQSRSGISEAIQSGTSSSKASQSKPSVSETSQSKHSKSPGEQSIPEEYSSSAKSVSEEVKEESAANKTANDYDSATFESDDSTSRSRRSVTSQRMTSQNGEINVEDLVSLTETSDHSDLEETVRRLNEVLEREKKTAELLERKKRKIKRIVMKKEAMQLEIQIKNTRDDNHRKLAEIKTARQDVILSPREDREKLRKSSGYSTPVTGRTRSETGGKLKVQPTKSVDSSHEIEESLIEVVDDNENLEGSEVKRQSLLENVSARTRSEASDIPEEVTFNEKEESIVEILDDDDDDDKGSVYSNKDISRIQDYEENTRVSIIPSKDVTRKPQEKTTSFDKQTKSTSEARSPVLTTKDVSSDIPEEISEHSRSTASIPEQVPSIAEDEASKSSEIPEEVDERSYTPIASDASVRHDNLRVVKDSDSKAISPLEQSLKSAKDISSRSNSYSYGDDTFENSYTEPRTSTYPEIKASISQEITPEKSRSISEHLTGLTSDKRPNVFENVAESAEKSASVSDELSYTEPESDSSDSEKSSVSHREKSESLTDRSIKDDRRTRSDASDISEILVSDDEISPKSKTSSRRSRVTSEGDSDRETKKLSSAVPEQQPAIRSDDEKSSLNERQKSPEVVDLLSKASPRLSVQSPRDSALDVSRSEASSIAEEIPSGYEDEDISESALKGGHVEKLILEDAGDKRNEVRESSLNDVVEIGLNEPGLDGLDRTELDESVLDKPGFNEPKEKGLDETELDENRLEDSVVSESKKQQESGDVEYTSSSRKNEVDILPVKQTAESDESSRSVSSQRSRSRGLGTNEKPKDSGDEQEYSDDFDEDASIPEEISEIGEEFSEKAEDSDKGENFVVFESDDRIVKDSEDGTHDPGYKSGEHKSESRVDHVVDDITNGIYKDLISDSLTTMKDLKTSKLQSVGKTISSDLIQQNRNSLTTALSTVTRKIVDNEGHGGTLDGITGHIDTTVDRVGLTEPDRFTERQMGIGDTAQEHIGTEVVTSGEAAATDRNKEGNLATDTITRDLLADAIMQILQIKRRKQENMKLAASAETKPSESLRTTSDDDTLPTGESLPDITKPTGTKSFLDIPEIDTSVDDEKAIDNALLIAKSNQILDDDALRSIDDDIAGLLGTPVDDEDEFPVNVTNFSSDILSDNEISLPEFSPMFAVPHSKQELIPMVNSTLDTLLEQRRLERPLEDCVPQAQFLSGETENELECGSVQSYRHLVFDLTKEVFIDAISQNEPATQPPWAKAKWKGGQKLSRHFKRWKSDDDIRAVVLERVTNVIGLGAPRATMATIPRKTPVRGNKKDNVDAILIEELRQEEPLWTDYEEDETNVKFQVADAILNMLLEDTVRVVSAIHAKKSIPDDDDVLVV